MLRLHPFRLRLALPFLTIAVHAARVETFTVPGGPGGNAYPVRCVVPDAYDGRKPFPELVLLHGASDNASTWIERGGELGALADKHARLIVTPTAGPFSWYVAQNGAEDYLLKSVLPAVGKRYRTTGDRWIAGNSMGGYGALRLGAAHPELFSAYAGLSPGVSPSRWGDKWGQRRAAGPAMAAGELDLFTPTWLKPLLADRRPVLLICGDRDFFHKDCVAALEAAAKAGKPVITYPTRGDHNWKYWAAELPGVLDRLSAATRAAKP